MFPGTVSIYFMQQFAVPSGSVDMTISSGMNISPLEK